MTQYMQYVNEEYNLNFLDLTLRKLCEKFRELKILIEKNKEIINEIEKQNENIIKKIRNKILITIDSFSIHKLNMNDLKGTKLMLNKKFNQKEKVELFYEEKIQFCNDINYISFGFIFIANNILGFKNPDDKFNKKPDKPNIHIEYFPVNLELISFAREPIKQNNLNELNENIIAIRVDKCLNTKCLQLDANDLIKCNSCGAYQQKQTSDNKLFILCIDNSRSMKKDSNLDKVIIKCVELLKFMSRNKPFYKVCLIVFSDIAYYYGDGNIEEKITNETIKCNESHIENLLPIKDSFTLLNEIIVNLKTENNDKTFISKALNKSIEILTVLQTLKTKTEIVLCTDGEVEYNRIQNTRNERINKYLEFIKICRITSTTINTFSFEKSKETDKEDLALMPNQTNGIQFWDNDKLIYLINNNSMLLPDILKCHFCTNDSNEIKINSIEYIKSKLFILCIDNSKSMKCDSNLQKIKIKCVEFLETMSRDWPYFKVCLITFSDEAFYYGDGNIEEKITNNTIESHLRNFLPIKDSLSTLKRKILSLKIDNCDETCIKNVLRKSIKLIKFNPNSEIILCTDGKFKTEKKCDILIDYYNNFVFDCMKYLTKINTFTFENADENNVQALISMANQTNGKTFFDNDNNSFISLLDDNSTIDLNVICDSKLKFENKSNKIIFNNLNKNDTEILMEFKLLKKINDKNCVYFQFQFETSQTIRIITRKIKINSSLRRKTQLIHPYLISKVCQLILNNNFKEAFEFWKQYEEFRQNNNETVDLVFKINRIINNLKMNQQLRKKDEVFLEKNNKITSFDIQFYFKYLDNIKIEEKNTQSNLFIEISRYFVNFDQKNSEKQLLIGLELLKFANHFIELIDYLLPVHVNYEDKMDINYENQTVEDINEKIILIFNDIDFILIELESKCGYLRDWNKKNVLILIDLYILLMEFINKRSDSPSPETVFPDSPSPIPIFPEPTLTSPSPEPPSPIPPVISPPKPIPIQPLSPSLEPNNSVSPTLKLLTPKPSTQILQSPVPLVQKSPTPKILSPELATQKEIYFETTHCKKTYSETIYYKKRSSSKSSASKPYIDIYWFSLECLEINLIAKNKNNGKIIINREFSQKSDSFRCYLESGESIPLKNIEHDSDQSFVDVKWYNLKGFDIEITLKTKNNEKITKKQILNQVLDKHNGSIRYCI